MNGGSLDYKITADAAEFRNGVAVATSATNKLQTTTRIASTELKTLSKTLTGVAGSLAYTASYFAGPTAQQILFPVMLLGKEIKLLASSAKLIGTTAGFGLTGLGAAAAGAVIHVATLTQAFEALKAEMDFSESVKGLEDQFKNLTARLIPRIELLMKVGRISSKEGTGLINRLVDANTPETRQGAIGAAQARLQKEANKDAQFTARETLRGLFRQQQIDALPQQQQAEQKFLQSQDQKFVEALKQADLAGISQKVVADFFNQANAIGLQNIRNQFKAQLPRESSPVTDLEKMGGVLRGIGRGFDRDDTRRIADNTAKGNTLLGVIIDKLNNNDSSLYNQ